MPWVELAEQPTMPNRTEDQIPSIGIKWEVSCREMDRATAGIACNGAPGLDEITAGLVKSPGK
ncbi:hypothetical protein HPB50_025635 [Hyalomma asiaticum]|uniref:Uncharacterized protein n=1 Tax=Hyalomma asiaticum TaxID=266040 RepID=A0ACB7TA35_HYAAI|nr:hypothetical protein HPB50_025635 [Hyalomma asiaticum]